MDIEKCNYYAELLTENRPEFQAVEHENNLAGILMISERESISEDDTEKPKTRLDASSLLKQFKSIEMGLMAVFWTDVLNRLDAINKKLQMLDIDLQLAADLYSSLEKYFSKIRNLDNTKSFEEYERRAIELFGEKKYAADKKRKVKRKRQFGETSDNETLFNASDLSTLIIDNITDKSRHLITCYANDLEESMANDLIHFREFIKCIKSAKPSARELPTVIYEENAQNLFPNTFIALRIFTCTFITNCSAERSFSALKRIKTYLRSTMETERLNHLAVLHIESDLLKTINYDEVIDNFANKKVRRKSL
ncbi:uncharacterized protein LOC115877780 [Sitophilus oryzae]|uniref:Uncharacterized protein LOC115877780 n=1 Tax=Sitophilus oryzae TaxID=7048 RepID=A0A6J2XG90_SITOR|nr:uncharacterized protein LOC115877780 [Sitophilus oryzae]